MGGCQIRLNFYRLTNTHTGRIPNGFYLNLTTGADVTRGYYGYEYTPNRVIVVFLGGIFQNIWLPARVGFQGEFYLNDRAIRPWPISPKMIFGHKSGLRFVVYRVGLINGESIGSEFHLLPNKDRLRPDPDEFYLGITAAASAKHHFADSSGWGQRMVAVH